MSAFFQTSTRYVDIFRHALNFFEEIFQISYLGSGFGNFWDLQELSKAFLPIRPENKSYLVFAHFALLWETTV